MASGYAATTMTIHGMLLTTTPTSVDNFKGFSQTLKNNQVEWSTGRVEHR